MLFNSIEFAIFFPIVTILYWILPHRFRWLLLLLASCFFYMFFIPKYIFILIFTIVIDYFAGLWIAKQKNVARRKYLLLLSICANVGVLMVFKYYNFIAENINIVVHHMNVDGSIPLLNIILPIGLSFHTFQAMSYTIEVYRGNTPPEKHFGIYALYVMFYPQLVAGPIERPQNLLHQFHEKKNIRYEDVRSGLILIAWGLLKKVVIADRLAFFVNQVYGSPRDYTGLPLIIATVFFAFQIFCDFSGYSDIALGSARVMGFNLMTNFDRPYMSSTVGEFWRRWHISLSTWFRDYVYVPLGGNRVSAARWYFNILVVFLLSGIWHGANWTFVIWGLLHGMYLIAESKFYGGFPSLKKSNGWIAILVKRLIVFGLVLVGWIFFRSAHVSDAFYIVRNFFVGLPLQIRQVLADTHFQRLQYLYLDQDRYQFLLSLALLVIMMFVHYSQRKLSFDQWLIKKSVPVRWTCYYAMLLTFVCFGVFNRSGFIYFQF